MKKSKPEGPTQVVGYVRVSTDEQALSGLGLDAQRAAIETECVRRGWELMAIHEDAGISGKSISRRPGLSEALQAVESGTASAIVVAKLDRLSRSVRDAADLLERSARQGWSLVVLDVAVDTTTPNGEAMASMMAVFAQLERRLIGERTRNALAAKKAQGVRLGRPSVLAQDVIDRIVKARESGLSFPAIAAALNDDGVPTAHDGARWWPATVRKVLLGVETMSAA